MPKWSDDPRVDRISMNVLAVLHIAQEITQESGMDLEDAIVTVVKQFMEAQAFDEILSKNLIQELANHAENVDA